MRNSFSIVFAAIALCACGQPAQEAPQAPVVEAPQARSENLIASEAEIPPPVAVGGDLMAGLNDGGSATLRLDACPPNFNAAERLGTIMCGRDYTIFYEAATSRWVAIGPNAALVEQHAADPIAGAKSPGPPPAQRAIVVWQLPFVIDAQNQAALSDGTVVGHLVASGG